MPLNSHFLILVKDSLKKSHLTLSHLQEQALEEVSRNLELDLFSNLRAHFSYEEKLQILKIAAEKFTKELPQQSPDLRASWSALVVDFHRNSYWGFLPTLNRAEPPPLTENQKVTKELFPFVWVLVQSVVIMKAAVYYFGMQSSNEPSDKHTYLFIAVLLVAFGSPFLFAWRKFRISADKNDKD